MREATKLRLKVRHYEVDEYGHVNHANYVHYLETGRIEALESVGLSLAEMRRRGYLIVAVDLSVKYHAPARAGETLEITTHVAELRGARSVWIQEIREATTQRLVVTAEVTGAFMSEGGRPVRAPAAFHEMLKGLHVKPSLGNRGTVQEGRGGNVRRSRDTSAGATALPRSSGPGFRRWCVCDGARAVEHAVRNVRLISTDM